MNNQNNHETLRLNALVDAANKIVNIMKNESGFEEWWDRLEGWKQRKINNEIEDLISGYWE